MNLLLLRKTDHNVHELKSSGYFLPQSAKFWEVPIKTGQGQFIIYKMFYLFWTEPAAAIFPVVLDRANLAPNGPLTTLWIAVL